jgi:hypothetical protein
MKDEAGQIALDRMRKTYAGLDSYRDSGWVETVSGVKSSLSKMTFLTLFKRPNHFRFQTTFQVQGHNRTKAVWCDGRSAYSQLSGHEVEIISPALEKGKSNNPLAAAVWKATIPIAAFSIARLLNPDLEIDVLQEPHLLDEEESVLGEACYRLESKVQSIPGHNLRREFSVSRDRFVIRKVVEEMSADENLIGFATTWLTAFGLLQDQAINSSGSTARTEFIFDAVELNPEISDQSITARL